MGRGCAEPVARERAGDFGTGIWTRQLRDIVFDSQGYHFAQTNCLELP